VGAGAVGTRDTPGAALSREAGAGVAAPRAALHREAGTGTQMTRGDPEAALSREAGTTPPPPLPRPFVDGSGVVVPVTPLDNQHHMITRGKTGFRVVHVRLLLTVATSSPTSS
jgi:hypothetical protein